MSLEYVLGDVTKPIKKEGEIAVIVHICNNIGKWGKGFVLSISKRWKLPETKFKESFYLGQSDLGQVQFVQVEDDIVVANMVAQDGIYPKNGVQPIRYDGLRTCLSAVRAHVKHCSEIEAVHMPRIGCGLAGGDWNMIETIIIEELVAHGVSVKVYELDK